VDELKIADVLTSPRGPDDACQALVDLALSYGGTDNVTVLLGKYRIPGLVSDTVR
jgi:serine/threonine protein phosphatase PrpC